MSRDVYMGIGGAAEAVIAAAAIKCIDGEHMCEVWPRNDGERAKPAGDGVDLKQIHCVNGLICSDIVPSRQPASPRETCCAV